MRNVFMFQRILCPPETNDPRALAVIPPSRDWGLLGSARVVHGSGDAYEKLPPVRRSPLGGLYTVYTTYIIHNLLCI